jgi:putative hydrolase of the HAD superfamily
MRAILLDALGTLIGFEPPAPHLQAQLRLRGYAVTLDAASQAMRNEIVYYRGHLDEGRDAESLADLRWRCAEAMRLPGVPVETALDALLASLRFFAYPDSAPALIALRELGIRLVVVSNWDWSLHERLSETGLTPLLDGAISSAEAGVAKPDPAIFAKALALAGTTDAWHVGDTPEADLEGARAAGLPGILIDRTGSTPGAVKTLLELIPLAGPR